MIAQWLLVLKKTNKFYSDIDVSQVTKTNMEELFEKLEKHMKDHSENIDDVESLKYEEHLGSDVAQNQHTEEVDEVVPEVGAENQEGVTAMRYSFLARQEKIYLAEDHEDFRVPLLNKLADLDKVEQKEKDPDAPMFDFEPEEIAAMMDGFPDLVHQASSLRRQPNKEDAQSPEGDNGDSDSPMFDFEPEDIDDMMHGFPDLIHNKSKREASPLSDFVSDDMGLTTSFPDIFMMGKAYGKPVGSMRLPLRLHLLHQFTNVPAQDRRLLGFLFDVMQRSRVLRSVKTHVDGKPHALKTIQALLDDPEERRKLKEAIKYPKMGRSKKMLRKYLGMLRFSGGDIPYGAVEGSKLKHRIVGCTKRYADNTEFLTVSPNNQGNARSIRVCFYSVNNHSFPAKFEEGCHYGKDGEEFIEHLVKDATLLSEGNIEVPPGYLNKSARAGLGHSNPIAFVQENKKLLFDILDILLGITPDNSGFFPKTAGRSKRRSRYYRRRKGIFGHVLSLIGVTEDHQKGHLHWHLTVNAGLSSYALQRFANLPELCQRIAEVLDLAYKSELTPQAHVASLVRRLVVQKRKHWELHESVPNSCSPEDPLIARPNAEKELHPADGHAFSQQDLRKTTEAHASAAQCHANDPHNMTCHKGKWGQTGCRLGMPVAVSESTCGVLLVPRKKQKLNNPIFQACERPSGVEGEWQNCCQMLLSAQEKYAAVGVADCVVKIRRACHWVFLSA